MYSMSASACKSLASSNVRFNEIYLDHRVEVDTVAEQNSTMKSSTFGRVYEQILAKSDVKGCRIRVKSENDVDHLKCEQR